MSPNWKSFSRVFQQAFTSFNFFPDIMRASIFKLVQIGFFSPDEHFIAGTLHTTYKGEHVGTVGQGVRGQGGGLDEREAGENV